MRRRRLGVAFSSFVASVLVVSAAAWACTGATLGMDGALEVVYCEANPLCVPAQSGPDGFQTNPPATKGYFAKGSFPVTFGAGGPLGTATNVKIRWLTVEKIQDNHPDWTGDQMICMNPYSGSGGDAEGAILGQGSADPITGTFSLQMDIPDVVNSGQPTAVVICAIKDGWGANPVPFIVTPGPLP